MKKKISNTEKLTSKTNKYIKITLITLYFIILIFLIGITIYFFNKKDFTNEYQTSFTCENGGDYYDVSLDKYLDEEDNNMHFDIVVFHCTETIGECETERFNGGSSVEEAIRALNTIKRIIINKGCTCR